VEQVALAHVVNDEIRTLADRFELRPDHEVGWLCRCGCFTFVNATVAEYDASAHGLFAAGHPADERRVAATEAFEQQPDPSTVLDHVNEELRRRLTEHLARQLERQSEGLE
jgi:hypothetical protein